jgi:hypothetical protein
MEQPIHVTGKKSAVVIVVENQYLTETKYQRTYP